MDKYSKFNTAIKTAVAKFRSFDKNKKIRLISHLDADGISAAAILIQALNNENRKYSISIVRQLDLDKIKALAKESYDYFIFADLGSGQLNNIKEHFKDKEIIILDHHNPEEVEIDSNITHINPHLCGIDGSSEVAGAGVVYMFAAELNKLNKKLAHIAVVGAIGEVQIAENKFLPLTENILQEAVKQGTIKVKKGLRIFGAQTKPLHKVLEYSTDPYIPDVSGSESGAIQFLQQIGIDPKVGSKWKKLVHLNQEEMHKLIAGIILKRHAEKNPDDVLGNVFTLPNEEKESPTRDAKEFATLLNACGRMETASFGIGTCLGIKQDKQKALQTLSEYKKEIVFAMRWYEENKENGVIIQDEGFMIINAKDNVPATIVGTIASIIAKSNDFDKDTYIMSLANSDNNNIKISLRIAGARDKEIDLRDIVKEIIAKTGGEAGGHARAAGALIPKEKEQEFIKEAKIILKTKNI